jgi:alpha-L-arabinofuranosidase
VRCYLDDKLIVERTDELPASPTRLCATAVRDDATGKVILRTINPAAAAQRLTLNVEGITSIASHADIDQLSGGPREVNSVNEPMKLSTKRLSIENAAAQFDYEFPPHSLTIITLSSK